MQNPGRQLGRYRLLEQIGSGGMSVVYKGLDTTLDREVAVKVLHPHLAQKPEARRRLAREAKAVAALHHPNILEIFDFAGDATDEAFLVTEFIQGKTLKDFASEQLLDPPEIAAMLAHEISGALAHAHQAGILHRDLKPENVMVRNDGILKLMDFGIAKILDRDDRMTQTGALVGSPAHMAPEIIAGEDSGKEADVFSLGTLLYFLFTRRLPFEGTNTPATLKLILDGTYEDPRRYAPALSDDLVALLAKCLARSPEDRIADAVAVHAALASALSDVGIDRVSEELASFFADPPSYATVLRKRLVEVWIQKSELLFSQRPLRALSTLNQVLALDADDPRAHEMLRKIRRSGKRKRVRTWMLGSAVGTVALWTIAFAARLALSSHPVSPVLPLVTEPVGPASKQELSSALRKLTQAERPAVVFAAAGHLATPPKARPAPHSTGLQAPPAQVPFTVQVRPYGSVQLDDGAVGTDVLQNHLLSAMPGRHRIRISCPDFCDEEVDDVVVSPSGGDVFHLGARGKPALLSFSVDPPGAEVQVGEERRMADETSTQPILIRSARGPVRLEHLVRYEVRREGYTPQSGSVRLAPGEKRTLSLHLNPQ